MNRVAPVALALLSSAVAFADEPQKKGLPQELHDAPAISSPMPVPTTDVVFEGTTADKRLTGRFGVVWNDTLYSDFKLSAPVSDSGDPVTVATIDGLSAGTTAEASLAIVHWHPTADTRAQDRLCAAALLPDVEKKEREYKPPTFVCSATSLPPGMDVDAFIKKDAAGQNQMCVDYRKKLADDERAAIQKEKEALQRGELPPGKPCVEESVLAKDRAAFDAAMNYGTPMIAGIKLKLDEKTFKYYDPTTYETKKRKGINLSAGAYFGVIEDGWGTFSFLVRVDHSYTEGTKSTVCLPGTITGSLLCNDLAKGEPKASTKVTTAASFQRTLFGHLGVVGRVGFDVGNGIAILELPVYFIQPKGSSFTGGVVFSGSRKLPSDAVPMPEDDKWSTTALVFLGGRFDALGVNTTWK